MKITVKVEGLKELDRKLGNLKEDLRGKSLYSALMHASKPMYDEARQRAATAPEPHRMAYGEGYVDVKPGLLKSAIRRRRLSKKEHAKANYSAAVGISISKRNPQKLYPRYWHFVEYGTSKMPATPFLRPAFENNKEQAVERFKTQLAKRIRHFQRHGG